MLLGPPKDVIMPCVYCENGENRYEMAMSILRERYGSKNSVINALGGKEIANTIADFEQLSNELKNFNSVLKYYNVTSEFFSGEVVTNVLERRISKFSSREFTSYMNNKG